MTEEWRKVEDYPAYSVSSLGRVRRDIDSRCSKAGKILKATKKERYWIVGLCKNNTVKIFYIHRLVAFAFLGEPASSDMQVAHSDGNPDNNALSNLRWATPKENNADKKVHGTECKGGRHPWAKLTEDDVREIRRLRLGGVGYKQISEQFNIHRAYACLVGRGKRWSYV